jgi:F420-dependent oxidoreductase-like protein
MDLRIFTEPQQGATYDTVLAAALRTQECGYSAFFRSDHYLRIGGGDGRPGPTDAWTTLAGLARETSTIRLGTLVCSATLRYPGALAIQVAQVDQMSGGRVEFGLGAGWFEEEHAAYGIPFPALGERFDRLEEQLSILTGMWSTPDDARYDFAGKYYTVVDSPALPKPNQPSMPILIGGGGARRTPALAARFGSEYNMAFAPVERVYDQFSRVREACRAIGRDPDELTYSVALILCCGRNDAEVARRAAAIGHDVNELLATAIAGTPAQVVQTLGRYAEAGVQRMYLQLLDLSDLDQLDLVAAEVAPQFS